MPFAENYMVSGLTTAAQSATLPTTININCGFQPTKVELTNFTQYGATGTGNLNIQKVWWDSQKPTTTYTQYINAAGTALLPGILTSNGISTYNGGAASPYQIALGPKLAGTNTAIATGTFTISSTASLYAGATILMTGNSVNKQLGGMFFTVATVASGTTFTIANSSSWLNTASFTNGAETFNVQLVTTPALYTPQNAQITFISAANPAVITTSTNMNVAVGQQVRIVVPSKFAMTQANGLTAVVSAVSANQITLAGANGSFGVFNGLDSSAFTAFSWPAATGVPYSPALVIPIGSGPYPNTLNQYNDDTIQDQTLNSAFNGFIIGTNILKTSTNAVIGSTASDVYVWTAWRGDV